MKVKFLLLYLQIVQLHTLQNFIDFQSYFLALSVDKFLRLHRWILKKKFIEFQTEIDSAIGWSYHLRWGCFLNMHCFEAWGRGLCPLKFWLYCWWDYKYYENFWKDVFQKLEGKHLSSMVTLPIITLELSVSHTQLGPLL